MNTTPPHPTPLEQERTVMNPTLTAPKRRPVKAGFAAVLAVAALGAGVFASFTDTETASRSVAAGQLDIQVSPEVLSVTEMAPGDIFSRGMVIDVPDATNNGNLIEYLTLDIEQSVANTICGDVNPECENEVANLLDGNALQATVLACPDGGQILDANPTVDDDGDPSTDPRYDGPGPYTCTTGDFAVAVSPGPVRTAGGFYPQDPGFGHSQLGPKDFAAPYIAAGGGGSPFDVFVDGTTIEAVTCIQMFDDMVDQAAVWTGSTTPDSVDANDYQNLSADIRFGWKAHQRPGILLPSSAPVTREQPTETRASCGAAFGGGDGGDPGDTGFDYPDWWGGSSGNQIYIYAFYDGPESQSNGLYNPGGTGVDAHDRPYGPEDGEMIAWLDGEDLTEPIPIQFSSNGGASVVGAPNGTYTLTIEGRSWAEVVPGDQANSFVGNPDGSATAVVEATGWPNQYSYIYAGFTSQP